MSDKNIAKVPISIWIVVFCGLVFFMIISQYYRNNNIGAYFEINRIKNIHHNGVIVVGTSLVRYGFPYDHEFELLAQKYGLMIEFIRFSRSNGKPHDFEILGDAILKSKPRWVFLQTEPFFLEFNQKHVIYRGLTHIRENIHFLILHSLFTWDNKRYQNDINLKLDEVTIIEKLQNKKRQAYINPPFFPKYFESFLKQATENNIRVILLEMNYSKKWEDYIENSFRAQLNETLQQVSQRYHIALWQFRNDLPLDHYTDGAHLNRKGRAVFSDWFLSKLAQENHYD
ncbi:MAG: SGNH/GDSL hydrolase family protein [Thiomargarita sp.]|nr:SGNH/GDSL hydrolase family protein [Thiomargarita sp.]